MYVNSPPHTVNTSATSSTSTKHILVQSQKTKSESLNITHGHIIDQKPFTILSPKSTEPTQKPPGNVQLGNKIPGTTTNSGYRIQKDSIGPGIKPATISNGSYANPSTSFDVNTSKEYHSQPSQSMLIIANRYMNASPHQSSQTMLLKTSTNKLFLANKTSPLPGTVKSHIKISTPGQKMSSGIIKRPAIEPIPFHHAPKRFNNIGVATFDHRDSTVRIKSETLSSTSGAELAVTNSENSDIGIQTDPPASVEGTPLHVYRVMYDLVNDVTNDLLLDIIEYARQYIINLWDKDTKASGAKHKGKNVNKNSSSRGKYIRRYTNDYYIDLEEYKKLSWHFFQNPYPSANSYATISKKMGIHVPYLKTWFQKQRHICRSGDKDWSPTLNLMLHKRGRIDTITELTSPPVSPKNNKLPVDKYSPPETSKFLYSKSPALDLKCKVRKPFTSNPGSSRFYNAAPVSGTLVYNDHRVSADNRAKALVISKQRRASESRISQTCAVEEGSKRNTTNDGGVCIARSRRCDTADGGEYRELVTSQGVKVAYEGGDVGGASGGSGGGEVSDDGAGASEGGGDGGAGECSDVSGGDDCSSGYVDIDGSVASDGGGGSEGSCGSGGGPSGGCKGSGGAGGGSGGDVCVGSSGAGDISGAGGSSVSGGGVSGVASGRCEGSGAGCSSCVGVSGVASGGGVGEPNLSIIQYHTLAAPIDPLAGLPNSPEYVCNSEFSYYNYLKGIQINR